MASNAETSQGPGLVTLNPLQAETQATPASKPIVIGLYGIAGCGKSHLLNQLKQRLPVDAFTFHDGSAAISSVVPGGLAAFKVLDEEVKQHYRELAIKKIRDDSAASGKAAVVAGHYMFWDDEAQEFPTPVSTPADWDTYTHIVYLRIPTGVVTQRRRDDTKRQRPAVSEDHLGRWMQTEHTELQKMCLEHGVLFCPLYENNELLDRAEMLLRDFRVHSEAYNLYRAKRELGEQLADVARGNAGLWQTALVFDADRTLTEEDTGRMFWDKEDPLKAIFSSHLGYSYTAFRQATLLYEGEASSNCQDDFDQTCNLVADAVKVYPELANLISQAAGKEHVLVVVLTCGPVHVWRKILARLGSHIVVIGGGRIADGFVVDPEMKATLVRHIRAAGCPHVWAFGDSPLDLPMLREADEGVVVVGDQAKRSQSMEAALGRAIASGMRARQARIPPTTPPRLDTWRLPPIDLADAATVEAILARRGGSGGGVLRVVHAGDRPSARLLATPTRDASIRGHELRTAHHRIGWYLAVELVPRIVGLGPFSMPHVQGGKTEGYALRDEAVLTTIVALMRGGEPMALGVSEAFPRATFLHARTPDDVKVDHVVGKRTVLLVDSVVNSGKSLVEFVQRVRGLDHAVDIVFVAGVVQSGAFAEDGYIARHVGQDRKFTLVALRVSENKYTGLGTTDTGNRLFNTTHLD